MYLLVASIVQAWNWVSNENHIQGMHDNWDWTYNKAPQPLGQNDSIIWMTCAIDYIRSFFSTEPSIYQCPADIVDRVQDAGDWGAWTTQWSFWYSQRQSDGSAAATTNTTHGIRELGSHRCRRWFHRFKTFQPSLNPSSGLV